MKTIILAGGRGTRLGSEYVPKPLVEIGDRPIIHHIMDIYAKHGFTDFRVAAGFRHWLVKSYFAYATCPYSVKVIDTGYEATTGERIIQTLPKYQRFFLTYGDGLADINITDLLENHIQSQKLVTVTAVNPPSRFGSIASDGEFHSFKEKPLGLISGGFFVVEPEIIDYLTNEMWELDALPQISKDGYLNVYQHKGFFQPMDTPQDYEKLNRLWEEGAPWLKR